MAYYFGTATNYADLFDIIVARATEAGNDWVIVEDERNTSGKNYIILKGIGDDGLQKIYVGLEKYANPLADNYGFRFNGFAGYQAGQNYFAQAGAIPFLNPNYLPTVPLWNNPIPYWLVVNKRRICFVAKVSTNYFAGYLGYILPFATGGQFPYPLAIGGSNRYMNRYDDTSANNTHFVIPYVPTVRLRSTDGTWRAFALSTQQYDYAATYPYSEYLRGNYNGGWFNVIKTPNSGGDVFPVQPILLFEGFGQQNHRGNIYGQFDGCFHVGGLDNAVENILSIGGQDYLIVQNIFRTTPRDFWAMRLA